MNRELKINDTSMRMWMVQWRTLNMRVIQMSQGINLIINFGLSHSTW
ncbi:unnamed protein product [Linum tenue]|uniref:Uncharacterized protein n=1 Tax=Linum tenue TaxID=586396 RepID=A0AAV0I2A7_9ROSI|nr:unnamed protein product [Linum tenue]